jgi:hypothetical protein
MEMIETLLTDKERRDFQHWISVNWHPKYHNFSIKEDGSYYFDAMEDAWGVWLGAKGFIEIYDENNDYKPTGNLMKIK